MLLTYDFFNTANYIYKEMQKTSLYFFSQNLSCFNFFGILQKRKLKSRRKNMHKKDSNDGQLSLFEPAEEKIIKQEYSDIMKQSYIDYL